MTEEVFEKLKEYFRSLPTIEIKTVDDYDKWRKNLDWKYEKLKEKSKKFGLDFGKFMMYVGELRE